eukprot:scaffold401449_cov59-Attheya_sp.AAC.1
MTLMRNKKNKTKTLKELTPAEQEEVKKDFQIAYNEVHKNKKSLVVAVEELTQVLRIPKNQTETVIDCKFFGTMMYTHNETATQDNFKTFKGATSKRWKFGKKRTSIFLYAFDEMLTASAIDGMLNTSVITGELEQLMDNETATQDNEMINASAIDGMLNASVITGVLEDFMGNETETQDNFTTYKGPGLPEGKSSKSSMGIKHKGIKNKGIKNKGIKNNGIKNNGSNSNKSGHKNVVMTVGEEVEM